MSLQGQARYPPQRPDDWRSHRDVGYEMPVHHIHMDAVRTRPLCFGHLLAQTGKVRRQDRRRQLYGVDFHFGGPFLLSSTACMSFFKNVHKLPIAAGYLCHSVLPRRLLVPPVDERLPEVSPTHSEADETRNAGRCRQPLANFCLVLTPPQDDAADFAATASARRRYNLRAVLAAVQSLDFPHVRLHLSVLELLDSLDHQPRSQLQVVSLLVAFELLKLRFLRRHQQLEHQRAATFTTQVVRKPLQAGRLTEIESLVALGVVAHEYLAEGRLEALDVLGELLAVFKVELLLPALLCRTGGRVTLLGGVTKYGRTELLVHQDAGFFFG